jgi:hypothetical protein
MRTLTEYGMQDQAEVIDYTTDYFHKNKSFAYQDDPNKRIHIAYAVGDAAGSELKQLMQRLAHIEIRSPGENAITGAKVGTLELCTPPGGPNEIYNMIWAGKEGVAHAINWTSDTHAVPWQKTGITTGFIKDSDTQRFPDLMLSLRQNHKDKALAQAAYERTNLKTGYAVVGLLIGELLRRDKQPVSDRKTVSERLFAYMHDDHHQHS